MPSSIPDAATLLAAAVKYLDAELMPTLSGYHRFQTRVTINVLNIIRRELEKSETNQAAELGRLKHIVGRDGSVDDLNRVLCGLIRAGQIQLDEPNLRDHVKQSLADALAINNPKWMVR